MNVSKFRFISAGIMRKILNLILNLIKCFFYLRLTVDK